MTTPTPNNTPTRDNLSDAIERLRSARASGDRDTIKVAGREVVRATLRLSLANAELSDAALDVQSKTVLDNIRAQHIGGDPRARLQCMRDQIRDFRVIGLAAVLGQQLQALGRLDAAARDKALDEVERQLYRDATDLGVEPERVLWAVPGAESFGVEHPGAYLQTRLMTGPPERRSA